MVENDPQPGNKGFFQRILDKFKSTSKEVADKVEDTVEDVKNSEFAGKVADTAKTVGEKAKDVIQDVKESEFVDKVGDAAGNIAAKAKDMIQDVKESEFVDKVGDVAGNIADKAKEMGSKIAGKLGKLAGLSTLMGAADKFQNSPEDTTQQENLLNELDQTVAAIIEDGVITPEEEAELAKKAEELGINVEDFLKEVREKLAAKQA